MWKSILSELFKTRIAIRIFNCKGCLPACFIKLLLSIMFILVPKWDAMAQITYSGKLEVGYLNFQHTIVDIDPGPGWKGYNLDNNQNGKELNFANGISFWETKGFAGLGFGYQNFEGIDGIACYSEFQYKPLNRKLSPLFNLMLGYDHIWNQYENGTGSILFEPTIGVDFKVTKKISIFLRSGLLVTQQSSFLPFIIGIGF